MSTPLEIITLQNGSLEENCYFFRIDGAEQALLVDPGAEFDKLDQAVSDRGVQVAGVLATHGHFDHVGQVFAFQEKYACPLAMHADDSELLDVLEDGLLERGFESLRSVDPSARSTILGTRPPAGGLDLQGWYEALRDQGVIATTPDGVLRFAPHWPNSIEQMQRVLAAVDRIRA